MSQAQNPVKRLDREAETRSQTARPTTWKPASAIPEVAERPGYKHRWIRKAIYGVADPTNLSKRRREGWEPCRLEDYEELKDFVDPDARNSGLVEIGGLVLHRIGEEIAKKMADYYAGLNQQAVKSAEAMYASQANADSRMPIFKENKTSVKFGSGS